MIYKNDIMNLKTDLGEKIGQKIIVKGTLGRSRPYEEAATIEKTYPNIFVVKYEENQRNVTYTYTDVLTRAVEVQVYDGVRIYTANSSSRNKTKKKESSIENK